MKEILKKKRQSREILHSKSSRDRIISSRENNEYYEKEEEEEEEREREREREEEEENVEIVFR